MKALKGKIPGAGMTPGPGGEEDEDEDAPFGPQPGMQEGLGRDPEHGHDSVHWKTS